MTSQLYMPEARHRLEVLHLDTATHEQRDQRRITMREHESLEFVLIELHRSNMVMNEQREKLQEYAQKEFLRNPNPRKKPAPTPAQKNPVKK